MPGRADASASRAIVEGDCAFSGERSRYSDAARCLCRRQRADFAGNLAPFDVKAWDADAGEQDVSWFDWSRAEDISRDGNLILFDESGEGGGSQYSVYLYRGSSHQTVRVGEGRAMALSPDGQLAITLDLRDPSHLNVIPLSAGRVQVLSGYGVHYQAVRFFPSGDRLLVRGAKDGEGARLWVQRLSGGAPEPLGTDLYLDSLAISPDGERIAGLGIDHELMVVTIPGGEAQVVPGASELFPTRWSEDSQWLFVQKFSSVPSEVFRVNVHSGQRQPWRKIAPPDLTGVLQVGRVLLSADSRSYAYSVQRTLSELYVASGWK
jgi:WD40 repeat protein